MVYECPVGKRVQTDGEGNDISHPVKRQDSKSCKSRVTG